MTYKHILFAFGLVVAALIVWYGIDVFLLAFAAILFAILLYSIGIGTQKIIKQPYIVSLIVGIIVISGFFFLIFYLYSPLIAEQFQLLQKQLPEATITLKNRIAPYLDQEFLSSESVQKGIVAFNQSFFKQALTLFSNTITFILSFVLIIITGIYLAVAPDRYVSGAKLLVSKKVWTVIDNISRSLRYWLLGKVIAMVIIGLLTFLGLWILNISLALILGLIAGLLTFIPYLGPILSAVPAILIAFAQSPLSAAYVVLLYIGIHLLEGYFITPYIEQKTVSIPPALSILGQVLFYVLFGGLGLALATPLLVVALVIYLSLRLKKATNH